MEKKVQIEIDRLEPLRPDFGALNRILYGWGYQYRMGNVLGLYQRLDQKFRARIRLALGKGKGVGHFALTKKKLTELGLASLYKHILQKAQKIPLSTPDPLVSLVEEKSKEVSTEVGSGLKEKFYQKALACALGQFEACREMPVSLQYMGTLLGELFWDLTFSFEGRKIGIEIKCLETLSWNVVTKLKTQLRHSDCDLAILLQFHRGPPKITVFSR